MEYNFNLFRRFFTPDHRFHGGFLTEFGELMDGLTHRKTCFFLPQMQGFLQIFPQDMHFV